MTGFRLDPEVLTRKVGDELVLVHMGRSEIFSLSATGARLLELLGSGLSPGEAVERMKAEYDAPPETIEREAEALLALLEREGLTVPSSSE